MFLWELYMQAHQLYNELDYQLRWVRYASVDDARVTARDDLALWIDTYNAGHALWADGFNAAQAALDALESVR
jgi:hypothetical protein